MKTNRKPFMKICLTFQRRDDGGLRVYSDDVPELLLSHRNYVLVMEDVAPALETILGDKFGVKVRVGELKHIRESLEDHCIISPYIIDTERKTYVADFEDA